MPNPNQEFQEGDTLGGQGEPNLSKIIQDVFIRSLVLTARMTDHDPEDVAEILASPEKSEDFHEEVLEAMSELDEMEEELEDAVEEAKENIKKQAEEDSKEEEEQEG